jgi:hypothetical protein
LALEVNFGSAINGSVCKVGDGVDVRVSVVKVGRSVLGD